MKFQRRRDFSRADEAGVQLQRGGREGRGVKPRREGREGHEGKINIRNDFLKGLSLNVRGRTHVSQHDLVEALRMHGGMQSLSGVEVAYLERSGDISVVKESKGA
jgi:hypothetical protein